MLKGIDPLLSPQLLAVLREMGHGDEIAVVDANFTAARLAKGKPVIRLDGITLHRACEAILSVLALDAAVEQPVSFMKVCDTPDDFVSSVQEEVINLLVSEGYAEASQCEPIERFEFYDRVENAYAFVQTGERRTYANFIFKKGVI
ncbi:RbsD/FucU family protein [Leeia oryzae]|uniref:RbsD/FucU family protein n=1 Tax=Leeia oryzae TaxID=356662 RepID=UPI00036F8B86|nr:RbsD/FucU domain-containing protein [Leeia oryzae]